jgi:hypothetical protein
MSTQPMMPTTAASAQRNHPATLALSRIKARRIAMACSVMLVAACAGGCIEHKDIDYTERVIELVCEQTGETRAGIEMGTRLQDLKFTEADLKKLVTSINEETSLKITVAELKQLPNATPSWGRLRLHDIGSFVRSKVLDKREQEYPENVKKGSGRRKE